MLKIFTDISHYNPTGRGFLNDVLRPFIPINKLDELGIKDDLIKLVNRIEECDLCLMPMAWNYYINTHNTSIADKFIRKAQENHKKMLIGVYGDYYIKLPNYEHIIGMYVGSYQSLCNYNEITLPVIIRDPLQYVGEDKICDRDYNLMPSIGFCGQVDSNIIISMLKMGWRKWNNIKYYLSISKYYSGPASPPTYLRKKVLDILDKADGIHTDFIRRNKYQGGKSKNDSSFEILREIFYQNIINSDYTICIRGTGNFSARFYETLALGRIPIFINTDCILPFSDVIDWKKHLIWIEQNEISEIETKILQFHHSLTEELFQKMQKENRMLWEKYFKFSGFYKELSILLKLALKAKVLKNHNDLVI